jgi:hypothetical protein
MLNVVAVSIINFKMKEKINIESMNINKGEIRKEIFSMCQKARNIFGFNK